MDKRKFDNEVRRFASIHLDFLDENIFEESLRFHFESFYFENVEEFLENHFHFEFEIFPELI